MHSAWTPVITMVDAEVSRALGRALLLSAASFCAVAAHRSIVTDMDPGDDDDAKKGEGRISMISKRGSNV